MRSGQNDGVGDKCPYTLQPVVEKVGFMSFLPIVYLLRSSGHIVDALKAKRYKARAEVIPIYIHIYNYNYIIIREKKIDRVCKI